MSRTVALGDAALIFPVAGVGVVGGIELHGDWTLRAPIPYVGINGIFPGERVRAGVSWHWPSRGTEPLLLVEFGLATRRPTEPR